MSVKVSRQQTDRTFSALHIYFVLLTVCVCLCVLQASKYSEQVCSHETGCQPSQKEGKSIHQIVADESTSFI